MTKINRLESKNSQQFKPHCQEKRRLYSGLKDMSYHSDNEKTLVLFGE